MKTRGVLLVCAVLFLSGCYRSGRLYPVQGPLAAETAPPIFSAKLTGAFNSGNLSVTLTGGEVCTGAWGLVSRKPTNTGNTQANTAVAPGVDWPMVWDAVYGGGFYNANVLGAPLHVRSTLTCSKGTILDIELYRRDIPGEMTEIRGVADDNRGNIYKVVI